MNDQTLVAMISAVAVAVGAVFGWLGQQYYTRRNGKGGDRSCTGILRIMIAEHQMNCPILPELRELRQQMVTKNDLMPLIKQLESLTVRFENYIDRQGRRE